MPRNKTRAVIAAALTATVALAACDNATVYNHYVPVADWERTDTVVFTTPPVPTDGTWNEELGLKANSLYPFTTISIIVETTVMPAKTTHIDTLSCTLTDSRGYHTGRGLSSYQYMFRIASLPLRQGDSIVVTMRHNMRRETLPGIENIGLKLSREQY